MLQSPDLIWTLVGLFLTLFVFSYLLGDNPLFRLTTYLFVGVASGYAVLAVFYQVLYPRVILPLLAGDAQARLMALIPLVLSGLLLMRISPRLGRLGVLPMAYLTGAGAAVIVGGAVVGTLSGQLRGAIAPFAVAGASDPLMRLAEGGLLLVGAVCTLVYFQYSAANRPGGGVTRGPVVETLAKIGEVFIGVTLGAVFAGVFAAALTALVERLGFIVNTLSNFF